MFCLIKNRFEYKTTSCFFFFFRQYICLHEPFRFDIVEQSNTQVSFPKMTNGRPFLRQNDIILRATVGSCIGRFRPFSLSADQFCVLGNKIFFFCVGGRFLYSLNIVHRATLVHQPTIGRHFVMYVVGRSTFWHFVFSIMSTDRHRCTTKIRQSVDWSVGGF